MDYNARQRPMEHLQRHDGNVPIAWRHRELTLTHPSRRPSSPSITSSSSDDREEIPIVRHQYRPLSRTSDQYRPPPDQYRPLSGTSDQYRPPADQYRPLSRTSDHYATIRNGQDFPFRTGTLRSTRSVPSLALMDPCPVHGGNGHHRRHGSLFDIRSPPPMGGPLSLAGLDKKAFYGSKHSISSGYPLHPSQYMPPPQLMMRPPQQPLLIEPMLMRDHFNKSMAFQQRNGGYPTKEPVDPYRVEQVCCKGHLIVLWIILGVVTVGVILGIIMGVTIT